MRKIGMTIQELKKTACAGLNQDVIKELEQPGENPTKKSKYGNSKVEVDGIIFDSGKEAGRYCQLRLMERAGIIQDLQLQVEYELNPGGTYSLKYIADFVYSIVTSGEQVVEDVKGFRTKEYKKKKRLMKKIHRIEIHEI